MTKQLIITNSITINESAQKTWDALVNPAKTKTYMYGCEAISEWKAGSELLWQGVYEGQKMVFVKGNILSIEPEKKLVYTTFDPNGSIEDIPENHVSVTYELTENNGQTTLHVSQGDFATVAEGERRYKETYNNGEGWNPILVQIKKLVESE